MTARVDRTVSLRCYVCDTAHPKAYAEQVARGDVGPYADDPDRELAVIDWYGLIHLTGPADQFTDDGVVFVCPECIRAVPPADSDVWE